MGDGVSLSALIPAGRLCGDRCVPFRQDHTFHVFHRVGLAADHHLENPWRSAAYQCHTLLVSGHGLLGIPAVHVPEHDVRKLVSVILKHLLRVLEVGYARVGTAVELHIADDVKGLRHFLLRRPVADRRVQKQPEGSFQVRVAAVVKPLAELDLLQNITPLDLDDLRPRGEGDKVVVEITFCALREIDRQAHGHVNRTHAAGVTGVHASASVQDHHGIASIREVFQRPPRYIQAFPFLLGHGHAVPVSPDVAAQTPMNDVVRIQGPGIHLRLPFGDGVQIRQISFLVVPDERLPVLQHRLAGLLAVVEGVILFPKVVLDDPDMPAKDTEALAVGLFSDSERLDDFPRQPYRFSAGRVRRRKPFREKGNIIQVAETVCSAVMEELPRENIHGSLLTVSVQQAQQVVPPSVLGHQPEILLHGLRLPHSQFLQNGAKDFPLSQAAANISGVEEDLHRHFPVLRESAEETVQNILVRPIPQRADGREQVQAVALRRQMRRCAVLGHGVVRLMLQIVQIHLFFSFHGPDAAELNPRLHFCRAVNICKNKTLFSTVIFAYNMEFAGRVFLPDMIFFSE